LNGGMTSLAPLRMPSGFVGAIIIIC